MAFTINPQTETPSFY